MSRQALSELAQEDSLFDICGQKFIVISASSLGGSVQSRVGYSAPTEDMRLGQNAGSRGHLKGVCRLFLTSNATVSRWAGA